MKGKHEKWKEDNRTYENETDHGRNLTDQAIWDGRVDICLNHPDLECSI